MVLTLCGYLAGYNVGKVSAALTYIRADLDLSLFLAGTLASSYSVAAMLSAVAIGLFVSRLGAITSVFIGLLLTGSAGVAGATANDYILLIGSRVVEGIGYILLAIAIPVLIAQVTTEKSRPMAMGIWGTFVPGGIALSMLVAIVVQNGWGDQWRPLWWFSCVLMLACLLLMILTVVPVLRSLNKPAASATTARAAPVLYASVFDRDPLLLAGCFALYSMFFVTLVTYLPTVFVETANMQVHVATRLSVFVALFNIAGNLLGGWLYGFGIRLKTLLSVALIGACLFSTLVFMTELPVEVRAAGGLLACLFGGMLPASVFATISRFVTPQKSGLLLGVVFQALAAGQVLGPILLAALVERMADWQAGVVYFLSLASVSAVVLSRFQVANHKA